MNKDIYIKPKKWNNKLPQVKKNFENAGNDVREIKNNGALLGTHLFQGVKGYLSKEKEDISQTLNQKPEILDYSKEVLHDIKELGKYTGMLVRHLLKSGGYTLYSALDYVDTQISKTGLLRKKENSEIWNTIKEKVRNNTVKLLIVATLAGGGIYKGYQLITPSQNTINIENSLPFEKHTLPFWDENPDFFDTTLFHQNSSKETLAPGITIIRDAGIIFYVLQPEDCKAEYLKDGKIFRANLSKKLTKLPEFSYLLELPTKKTKSFNIPMNAITNNKRFIERGNFYIPLPLHPDNRTISPEDFANYAYEAIQEMKSGPYQKEMDTLLQTVNEQELISAALAFARSETSEAYALAKTPIGSVELHRREEAYKTFSFSYFHILMEKGKDGYEGPGYKARKKLGFTEGQTYHPKNATKLFLGYWFEKVKELQSKKTFDRNKDGKIDARDIFPLTEENISIVGKVFNGGNDYAKKLSKNYKNSKEIMKNSSIPHH